MGDKTTVWGYLFIIGIAVAFLAAITTVMLGAELHSSHSEEVWILAVEYDYAENYTIFYMPSPPRPFLKVKGIYDISDYPAEYLLSWTNIKSRYGEYNRLECLILIE